MFAYCNNNPLKYKDTQGDALETVWDIISLAASVADVFANPADPWAWAGLLGDIIDVAIPCFGGLGESVDVLKTTIHVVDKGDDIVDTARSLYHLANSTDDIKHATGSYIVLFEKGKHYIGKGGFYRATTSAVNHLSEGNNVTAIIWASVASKEGAFVTEFLLQSVFGVGDSVKNTLNRIWSPGKTIFKSLQ